MSTTPKSVIMLVVVSIAVIVVGIVAASAALIATGNPALPSELTAMAPVGLGGIIGLLASTRTPPEIPPGATLTQGQTTLRSAPSPDQIDAASALPAATTVVNVAAPAKPEGLDTSGLVTLEQQGIDSALGSTDGDYPKNANATQNQ